MPARAPLLMSSYVLRSDLVRTRSDPDARERRCRRRRKALEEISYAVNHAEEPPVSRKRVPIWPSQRPRRPEVRTVETMSWKGPSGAGGRRAGRAATWNWSGRGDVPRGGELRRGSGDVGRGDGFGRWSKGAFTSEHLDLHPALDELDRGSEE